MSSSSLKLVELLNQATNPNNAELDVTAVDGLCYLLQNEPQLAGEATEKLAFKIQSKNKTESLFALDTLEECMSVSEEFRSKVGKFHFLNELIKLVSKNYLGDQTDATVQARILDTLFLWTKKYPKETKIKDAYDVLKTQGVVHEPVKNIKTNLHAVSKTSPAAVAANRVVNDECSEKLKRLCNSKNPKDIEEANLLIQTMVREDTRRNEMKTKRLLELNKIKDLIELLDAMLDNYCPGETTQDELETIQDQFLACKKTPATIHRLAAETQHSEGMLDLTNANGRNRLLFWSLAKDFDKILQTGVKIQEVLQKYEAVIVQCNVAASEAPTPQKDFLSELIDVEPNKSDRVPVAASTLGDLSDVFGRLENETSIPVALASRSDILKPALSFESNALVDLMNNSNGNRHSTMLPSTTFQLPGKPVAVKPAPSEEKPNHINKFTADIDSLVLGMRSSLLPTTPSFVPLSTKAETTTDDKLLNFDAPELVESSDDQMLIGNEREKLEVDREEIVSMVLPAEVNAKPKSLADIEIDLDSIEPSNLPPRVILEEPKGLKIVLNFAKDRPRPDVTVIVVSTTNEGPESISNYQFEVAVSKPCKAHCLAASGTALPGMKPFRPPADGITQVLLIANPTDTPTNLVCILKYCVGNDPDPIRETCDVKNIPLRCN